MSNQNSMFSPQENIPHQSGLTDPYEQPQTWQTWQDLPPRVEQNDSDQKDYDYSSGYSGTEQRENWTNDQKLHPTSSKQIPTWQWILGGVILLTLAPALGSLISFILGTIFLILGVIAVLLAISQLSIRTIALPTQTFTVPEQPKLVIHNPTGSIRIHRGATSKVEIKATKYVNGWLGSTNEGNVDFVQNGATINITARSGYTWSPLGGLRNVTIDITAPEVSDIQIEGHGGTINIEGISGQIKATTNAGTINVQQATLSEQSSLKTNAGTITVRHATLKGDTRIDSNVGTISFNGVLAPQGTYRFATNLGTIDAVLSGNPSFVLTAKTDQGKVKNSFGSTIVGPAPHAQLELRTNLGTINVRRG
jgi:hypothetical protein